MIKKLISVVLLLTPLLTKAAPPVVSEEQFYLGAKWVWSYAEWDQSGETFSAPYLFEKYEVVAVEKNKITIHMSSGDTIDQNNRAHHKFVVNLSRCLMLGEAKGTLRGLRISFFTKSFDDSWRLVSKNHKALAFTEKFNCLSDNHPYHIDLIGYQENQIGAFQWKSLEPSSWYSFNSSSPIAGVMVKRNSRDILIKLAQAH